MKEIEQAVADAARKLVDGGALAAMVEKQVSETIKSIVSSTLSWHSDFGKSLSEAIKQNLCIDPRQLDLPQYNATVLGIVRKALDEHISFMGKEKLQADMAELLGTAAPAQMKLSELVEQLRKDIREDDENRERRGSILTCIVDSGDGAYSSTWVYLDEAEKTEKYRCKYRFLLSADGSIFCCSIEGRDPKKDLHLGSFRGFERTLFRCYAMGTKFEVDDPETHIWDDD
jgi:hypothetical protein